MRFRTREKTTNLGRFKSDKCRSCRSVRFHMDKKVKYVIAFGIRTVPTRVRYASVCERCGAEEPVKNRTARALSRKYFRRTQIRQQFSMALRTLIIAAVVAALVILPLAIHIPVSRDPEVLKSLVSADGDYYIKNGDDEVLAMIHVEDGVKTILWYDKVSVLSDTGSKGGKFYLHETYQEATDSSGNAILIRNQDDPGQLEDQYNTIIRQYYYNEDTDSLGYYIGVEDLSTITYTSRKVTYPKVYYIEDDEKQQYLTVMYLLNNARLSAQFSMSAATGAYDRLMAVKIDTLSGSRVTDQAYYYFGDDTIDLAAQTGLTPDSDAQDYVDFININGLEAMITCHFEFYGNTSVRRSQTETEPDEYGNMQTTTTNYTVTKNRGYYILQLDSSAGE